MASTNDSYAEDLNQIRDKEVAVLDEIDAIQRRHGILPHEIEKIQSDALAIVYEIDQIINRRRGDIEARPFLPPHAFPKLPAANYTAALAGGHQC